MYQISPQLFLPSTSILFLSTPNTLSTLVPLDPTSTLSHLARLKLKRI